MPNATSPIASVGAPGLFLIPIGFLNEHHEPTQYYSVFRNFVETSIIPTTWREGGLAVYGGTESGLKWNVGLTTGFNLANWDPSSNDGRDSPLGSIHQELSLAAAKDLSGYVSVNYVGIPGLDVRRNVLHRQGRPGRAGFPGPERARDALGGPCALAARAPSISRRCTRAVPSATPRRST